MQLIQFVKDHWDALVACQQALFIFLSLLFELLGKTQASKWFGTYATVDAGRLVRNAKVKATIVNGSMLVTVVMLSGCGASTQLVAATTSSGHSYPYCLEVTYPVLDLQANVVFCGTVEAVQTEQAHLAKLYPQAKFAIVKGTQQ